MHGQHGAVLLFLLTDVKSNAEIWLLSHSLSVSQGGFRLVPAYALEKVTLWADLLLFAAGIETSAGEIQSGPVPGIASKTSGLGSSILFIIGWIRRQNVV